MLLVIFDTISCILVFSSTLLASEHITSRRSTLIASRWAFLVCPARHQIFISLQFAGRTAGSTNNELSSSFITLQNTLHLPTMATHPRSALTQIPCPFRYPTPFNPGPYGGTHRTGGKALATVRSYNVCALPKYVPDDPIDENAHDEELCENDDNEAVAPFLDDSSSSTSDSDDDVNYTTLQPTTGGKSVSRLRQLNLYNDDEDNDSTTTTTTEDEDESVEVGGGLSVSKSLLKEVARNPAAIAQALANVLSSKSLSSTTINRVQAHSQVIEESDSNDDSPLFLLRQRRLADKSPRRTVGARAAPMPVVERGSTPWRPGSKGPEKAIRAPSVSELTEEDGEEDDDDDDYDDEGIGHNVCVRPSAAKSVRVSSQKRPPPTSPPEQQQQKSTAPRRRSGKARPSSNDDLKPFIKPDLTLASSIDHSKANPTQCIRQHTPYPAPKAIYDASHVMYWTNFCVANEKAQAKAKSSSGSEGAGGAIPWTIWEDDLVIGHMLDIRLDESVPQSEERFHEVSRRMMAKDKVHRSWTSIKNMWNRVGRARSGFDERRSHGGVAATSMQGRMKRERVEEEDSDLEEGEIRKKRVARTKGESAIRNFSRNNTKHCEPQ